MILNRVSKEEHVADIHRVFFRRFADTVLGSLTVLTVAPFTIYRFRVVYKLSLRPGLSAPINSLVDRPGFEPEKSPYEGGSLPLA